MSTLRPEAGKLETSYPGLSDVGCKYGVQRAYRCLRYLVLVPELLACKLGCVMPCIGLCMQAGALVLTLGKMAKCAAAVDGRQQLALEFVAAAALSSLGHVRRMLRWQLLALLEQLSPQMLWPSKQQLQEQGASAAPWEGPRDNAGCLPLTSRLRGQHLNRGLSALAEDGSVADGAGARTESPLADAGVAGRGSGGGGTDMWQQVLAAGGCPVPGSCEQQQLRRLGALAAAEWLPSLLTCPSDSEEGGLAPVPLAELLSHGAYRVAWAWLRLVARQALSSFLSQPTGPEPGAREGLTWGRLLQEDLLGTLHAAAVVKAALSLDVGEGAAGHSGGRVGAGGGAGGGGRSGAGSRKGNADQAALRAAVHEVLPIALDVLEVMVVTMPQDVGTRVMENAAARMRHVAAEPRGRAWTELAPGWGPGLPWDEGVKALLLQQGRVQLAMCLDRVCKGSLVDDDEREREREQKMCLELIGGWVGRLHSEPPELPGPAVDVGFARCAYPLCRRAEGATEAAQRLLLCGRCRAVGYCCPECQRADWAAGHKATCRAESAGAGGG